MLFGYKILVYCTSRIYDDSFSSFISSLNESLIQKGWRVFVFCTESNLSKQNKNTDGSRKIFELINFDIADALMISDKNIRDALIVQKLTNSAKLKHIPVIHIGVGKEDCYNIRFDFKAGFERVVRHIIEDHKITDLHFIAGIKDNFESEQRLEVFKEVLIEHDIPFTNDMVSYGDFWEKPTRAATQKLIDSGNLPGAIICANDVMALCVISTLAQNGYDCPDDVLVTGFDGISEIFFSSPRVTSSICDFGLFGIQTANYIFEITDNHIPYETRYVLPSLMAFESCGCNPRSRNDSIDYVSNVRNAFFRYRTDDMNLSNMSVLIHDCETIEDVSEVLENGSLYNMFVMLKAECIDPNVDPGITHSSSTYGNSMYVMLDTDSAEAKSGYYLVTEKLIPRMQNVLNEYKKPLIFSSLHSTGIPLGYCCFVFGDYDVQNFSRVGQISSWLSSAFSGYRNMQYQRALQNKIAGMFKHDPLTGLLNRIGFQREYNNVMRDDSVTEISLAMCDLDNLKTINDTFSHNEGDNAIRVVGEALRHSLPDENYCFFCRYGGDEIIALYTKKVDAALLQKNLSEFLDEYNLNSGKPYEVSTSLGVYSSSKHTTFEEMFGNADKLMYEQKLKNPNRRKA